MISLLNFFRPKFVRDEDDGTKPFLVIIQCDSGHLNSDLIACARYRVCDEAIRAKTKNRIRSRDDITHVLFVIRLPQQEIKSQFVGFQGDPWISVHVDDLRPTSEATVMPEQALNASISELFIGQMSDTNLSLVSEIEEHLSQQSSGSQLECSQEEVVDMLSSSSASHDSDSDPSIADNMSNEEGSLEEFHMMDIDDQLLEPVHVHHIDSVNVGDAAIEVLTSVEDVPTLDVPTLDVPTLDVPTLDVPTLDVPTLDVPTLDVDHLCDSALNSACLSPSENMEVEDTKLSLDDGEMKEEILLPPNTLPLAAGNFLGLSPPQDKISDSQPDWVSKMPTLDSFERNKMFSQKRLCADKVGQTNISFHPQHNRLLSCVQAAVSLLKDLQKDRSMDRIVILMALIPKVPQEQLIGEFSGEICLFMHAYMCCDFFR